LNEEIRSTIRPIFFSDTIISNILSYIGEVNVNDEIGSNASSSVGGSIDRGVGSSSAGGIGQVNVNDEIGSNASSSAEGSVDRGVGSSSAGGHLNDRPVVEESSPPIHMETDNSNEHLSPPIPMDTGNNDNDIPFDPNHRPADRNQLPDKFWKIFDAMGWNIEYHNNHNFSCWKNGSEKCRFKLPAHHWNQVSGLIELELVKKDDKFTFEIKNMISAKDINAPYWKSDERCLVFNATKRSNDFALLRDPTKYCLVLNDDELENGYLANTDVGRSNGLVSPCSALILVCCGGGGGCHNNLQHIAKSGFGVESYILKYVSKGSGRLDKSLVLLHEAMELNRTSIASDNETNPYRRAMFTLQVSINRRLKRSEFSITMILASLLGMAQYHGSHEVKYINVSEARKVVIENVIRFPIVGDPSEALNDAVQPALVEVAPENTLGIVNSVVALGINSATSATSMVVDLVTTAVVNVIGNTLGSQITSNIQQYIGNRESTIPIVSQDLPNYDDIYEDLRTNPDRPGDNEEQIEVPGNEVPENEPNNVLPIYEPSDPFYDFNQTRIDSLYEFHSTSELVIRRSNRIQARNTTSVINQDLAVDNNIVQGIVAGGVRSAIEDEQGVGINSSSSVEDVDNEEEQGIVDVEIQRTTNSEVETNVLPNVDTSDVNDAVNQDNTNPETGGSNSNLEIIAMHPSLHYLFRGPQFKSYSYLEYCILVEKKLIKPERNAETTGGRHRNFTTPFVTRLSNDPSRIEIFHPQATTHEQQLVSKIRIPLLTGKRVPKHPGVEPNPLNRAAYNQYMKEASDFATFFMTLLVPWDLDTGRPPFSFNLAGLDSWVNRLDLPIEDRIEAVNDSCHQGRVRYLRTCIVSTQQNKRHETINGKFRDQSADTKEQYLERQSKGARGTRGPSGETIENDEDETSDRNRELQSDAIQQKILDIRGFIEAGDFEPDDVMEMHALNSVQKIFATTGISYFKDTAIQLESICETDAATITQDYENMTTFVKPPKVPVIVQETVRQQLRRKTSRAISTQQRTREQTGRREAFRFSLNGRRASLQTKVNGLNTEQRIVYDHCARVADELLAYKLLAQQNCVVPPRPPNPYYKLVLGGPGTGKTYVMSCIVEKFKIESLAVNQERDECSICCAPTATAALLHEDGMTLHGFISQDGDNYITDRTRVEQKRSLYQTLDLLVVDEISMLQDKLMKNLDARCREMCDPNSFLGRIPCVVFLGDFAQLPPGIGGIKSTILSKMLEPQCQCDRDLRQFNRTKLTQQVRANNCVQQAEIVRKLNDITPGNLYPFSGTLLDKDCVLCRTAGKPTQECAHFHELTAQDVAEDPSWIQAPIISLGHSVSYRLLEEKISQFARLKGQLVFRWRCPSQGGINNEGIKNSDILSELDDATAMRYPMLWNYFTENLPIRVTHNSTIAGRVVNGSLGTLHSIRPRYPNKIRAIIEQAIIDQDVLLVSLGDTNAIARVSERDRKNAEDDVLVLSNDLDAIARVEIRKKNLETHIIRRPGDVITIDAPLAIFFNLPGAAPTLKQPLVFPTKSSSIKRRLLAKIFGIDQNRKKIQVNITDSGYICAFTGTGYSVQGQTLEKNILEVNRNRDNPPILSFYNVGASRVKNNLHLRILPFKIGPGAKDHLRYLRYEDEYLISSVVYNPPVQGLELYNWAVRYGEGGAKLLQTTCLSGGG